MSRKQKVIEPLGVMVGWAGFGLTVTATGAEEALVQPVAETVTV